MKPLESRRYTINACSEPKIRRPLRSSEPIEEPERSTRIWLWSPPNCFRSDHGELPTVPEEQMDAAFEAFRHAYPAL